MAIRSIQINLSADITNFQERMRRASSDLGTFGSEIKNQLDRVKANTALYTANLGHAGSAASKMAIESRGLSERIKIQAIYVAHLKDEVAKLNTEENANSTASRGREIRLSRETTKLVNMENKVKSLGLSLSQLRSTNIFERLTYQTNAASIATRSLVANLGIEASATQKAQSTISGLNQELEINARTRIAVNAELQRLVNREGNNSEEIRKQQLAYQQLGLTAQEMKNSVAEAYRTIRTEADKANEASVKLMETMRASVNKASISRASHPLAMAQLDTQEGVANLGRGASRTQVAQATIRGLRAELTAMEGVQTAQVAALESTEAALGRNTDEYRQQELQVRRTAIAMSNLRNQIAGAMSVIATEIQDATRAEVQRQRTFNQDRTSATMARITNATNGARLASQQLTASLGTTATAEQRAAANVRGWTNELAVNERAQRSLQAAIDRVSSSTGNNVALIRQLRQELDRMRLTATGLQGNISGGGSIVPPVLGGADGGDQYSGMGALYGSMHPDVLPALLIAGVAREMAKGVGVGIQYNAMLETNITSFKVMTGSIQTAAELMGNLTTMAAYTPFETTDLTKQATTLLQYGMAVKNIVPMLNLLGDVSLGQKDKFEVIAYNFAQAMSLGRLTAIDKRSMTLAGFNPLVEISALRKKKGLGEDKYSFSALEKEMEDAGLPIKELVEAMKMATSEGGRFFEAMKEQSKTFNGQMSTLRDNVKMTFGELAKPISMWITDVGLPAVISFTQWLQEFARINPIFVQISASITVAVTAIVGLTLVMWGLSKAGMVWTTLSRGVTVFASAVTSVAQVMANTVTGTIRLFTLGMAATTRVTQGAILSTAGLSGQQLVLANTTNAVTMAEYGRAIALRNSARAQLASMAVVAGTALVTTAAIIGVGLAIYTVARNWSSFVSAAKEAWEVIKNTTTLAITAMRTTFDVFIYDTLRGFDKIAHATRTLSAGDIKGFLQPAPESELTKSWGETRLRQDAKDLVDQGKVLAESAYWYNEATRIFGESVGDNMLADWKALKGMFPSMKLQDFKIEPLDSSSFLDTVKEDEDKAKKLLEKMQDEMRDFINKIKDKAKEFREALGLFEKAVVEKISPERLFVRLQNQLKIFARYQADLNAIRNRVGEDSPLYQMVKSMGVSKGASVARAYAGASDMLLNQSNETLRQTDKVTGDLATQSIIEGLRTEKKIDKMVNVNINGGLFLNGKEDLVKIITQQLIAAGVT